MTSRQPRTSQSHCPSCGWTSKITSAGLAQHALKLHSCDRTRRLHEATARGRARHDAVDRTPQPCGHKHANHQHGHYATYTLDACRCLPCCTAASTYELARVRRLAYGRHTLVDATPVRQHLLELSAAGVGWKRVAALADVSGSVVCHLLYGKGGRAPSRRVRPATATAILAVTYDPAPHALVDATATWRRLEALQAIGWSKSALAGHLGHTAPSIQYRKDKVHADTARVVQELYERLWDTDGGNERARRTAARNNWPPPMWWDDDDLNNPDYKGMRAYKADQVTNVRHTWRVREDEFLSTVHTLTRQGRSAEEIAQRLDVTPRTVQRARSRLRESNGVSGSENRLAS